jgi:hypothetical protein
VVFIHLNTESSDYVPAQTLTMKTVIADLKVVESYISTKTSAKRAAPPRDYTCTMYRCHLGSCPVKEQKKKGSDQKSSCTTVFGT